MGSSITARSQPTPEGRKSGGSVGLPPSGTAPTTRCARGPAHKIMRSANRCLPSPSRSRACHPVPPLPLRPNLTNRSSGAPGTQIICAVIAGSSSLRALRQSTPPPQRPARIFHNLCSSRRKEALISLGKSSRRKLEPPYVGCYNVEATRAECETSGQVGSRTRVNGDARSRSQTTPRCFRHPSCSAL